MKGLVYSGVLFNSAISSAFTLAIDPVLVDPFLIWPYVALVRNLAHIPIPLPLTACAQAIVSFVTAFAFPIFFKHLDKPVIFNDVDRMEGKQQPNYIAEHGSEGVDSLKEKH